MQLILLHNQFSLPFLKQPRTPLPRTRFNIYPQIPYSTLSLYPLNSPHPLCLLPHRLHPPNTSSQPPAIDVIISILNNEISLGNELDESRIELE